jgi:hypothetical protein
MHLSPPRHPTKTIRFLKLPHAVGLKLLAVSRTPKERPPSAHIRSASAIAEWKRFLQE